MVHFPAMRFRLHHPTTVRKRKFWLKGCLGLAGLGVIVFALGGCKLLMPAEIRDIQSRLDQDADTFQRLHPDAFHTYTVDGRTMRFVKTGTDGTKPLVLFVHGSPGDWRAWVEFLNDPDLNSKADLVAVDRPGFGGSGAGMVERSLEQQCRDIAPLLNHAAPGQRVVLVGHSFGGPVVCRLAMDHPDQVTDLIVLAGSIDPAQEDTRWYQYMAEWPVFRWLVPQELKMANEEIMPLKGGLTTMLPLWPKIHQRVTVIQGEADTLVPPANADFAARMMTNAQPLEIIRIPRMNHFLPWKQQDLVKQQILQHLQ